MSEIDEWLGVSAQEIEAAFAQSARSFEAISSESDLVEKYPQKWIAVFDGSVQVVDEDLESLLIKLDELAIPRNQSLIKFVEAEPRTLILNVIW